MAINGYRFDSVAVKEPKFEIDGVFLPPETENAGIVYFCEVQFQKDERLYERLFGEAFLYFYRNRERYSNWQAVVIYPTRSIEQSDTHPYRSLRRFGELSQEIRVRISNLPLSVLEVLSEALLDFSSLDDLSAWLEAH